MTRQRASENAPVRESKHRRVESSGKQSRPESSTDASILGDLQHQAGNQAVQRLILQRGGEGPFEMEFGNRHNSRVLAHQARETRAPDDSTVQRFGSGEHVEIGNRALPGEEVLIAGYGMVSYGEMIAMAGDYFGSLGQMEIIAQSHGRFGQQQIEYARWLVNPTRPKPQVGEDVVKIVDDRYNMLAAKNETHFSTGSAAGSSNREMYIQQHSEAMATAYRQGLFPGSAITPHWAAQEAFSAHYLTDAFSAGHIRTPRGQVQTHWRGLYPNFKNDLVRTISCYMANHINDNDWVGWVASVNKIAKGVAEKIREMGGSKLDSFSIEDLVSKVLHDIDNEGLDVTSAASENASGETQWRAVGDGFLYPNYSSEASERTQRMVEEAVRLSYEEAQQALRVGGGSSPGVSLTDLTNPANFQALPLIPSEDLLSPDNQQFDWQVDSIETLPGYLRDAILDQFKPGHEIRDGLDEMENKVPVITEESGFDLHTRDAWNYFKAQMLADPFGMIIRIGNGDTCP